MDINNYFDTLNKKLDEMSDEEFKQVLIDSGLKEDNSCQNCGECICLACIKRDNCRCDICNDTPIASCSEVAKEDN